MLRRNNNEANLPHQASGISFSTLTNLLHKIVLQPSSDQQEISLVPIQRTNQIWKGRKKIKGKAKGKKKRLEESYNNINLSMTKILNLCCIKEIFGGQKLPTKLGYECRSYVAARIRAFICITEERIIIFFPSENDNRDGVQQEQIIFGTFFFM